MKILKLFFIFLILTYSVYGCAVIVPKYRLNNIQHKYDANVALLEKEVESNPDVDLQKNLRLCEAYAGLKQYNKLFSCLDLFQKRGGHDYRGAWGIDYTVIATTMRVKSDV